MCCENVSPWLKLTLTDTGNTAFRITTEVVNIFFIGRNILNDDIFEVSFPFILLYTIKQQSFSFNKSQKNTW